MTQSTAIVLLGMSAAVLIVAIAWVVLSRRTTPDERERRRRYVLYVSGRMGDGDVTDAHGDLLVYSYEVSGVSYTASQDIRGLGEVLPREFALIIGPATVKYSARNPANSIVVCEQWSGLRSRRRVMADPDHDQRKGA